MATLPMKLGGVDWKECEPRRAETLDEDQPFATHHGIFRIAGAEMRCYRLSNGQEVIDADDMRAFFGALSN